MALALTAYAISEGFTLSRLAYDIPASSVSSIARGPLWTIRATDDVKIIVGVLQSDLASMNSAVFPSDVDEQDYDTAANPISAARDARSAARLNGVNYVFDRSDSPTNSGIRVLNDNGTVVAGTPLVTIVNSLESNETLVSNASTSRLYTIERINSSTFNLLEIDPIAGTKTTKYVSSVSVLHIAFNGAGDRIYLATNDTPTTNFRIVELSFPAFTLVQSHLIGTYNVEAIICYNPPNSGAARIVAQLYPPPFTSSQYYDVDLATNGLTALTSGSIAGDGMNVDPIEGRRAWITQRNEVYKLLAPEGGSFTDSVPLPVSEIPSSPTNLSKFGAECTGCETTLTWTGSEGATGYRAFWRYPNQQNWNQFYDGADTTATHAPVEIGTLYEYAVTAYNEDGESGYSNVIQVRPCCVAYTQVDRCDTSYTTTDACETVYRSVGCCGD